MIDLSGVTAAGIGNPRATSFGGTRVTAKFKIVSGAGVGFQILVQPELELNSKVLGSRSSSISRRGSKLEAMWPSSIGKG